MLKADVLNPFAQVIKRLYCPHKEGWTVSLESFIEEQGAGIS